MNKPNGRKRGRTHDQRSNVDEIVLELESNTSSPTPSAIGSLEETTVLSHLQLLGKEFVSRVNGEVYLKLEVGIPESHYFEENHASTTETLKSTFDISGFTISTPVAGAIERYITIQGKLSAVIRAGLYMAYVIRGVLNNVDEMSFDRQRQIEQRARFTGLAYYDIVPTSFRSSGSILKLAVLGSFKCIHDFVAYILETSPYNQKYLDDSLIFQYPVIQAAESNLFQPQDCNSGVLEANLKQALEFIYEKEYLDKVPEAN